jgi:cytochrome P450
VAAATDDVTDFNPFDPSWFPRAPEVYAALRQQAPVLHTSSGLWVVSRYAEVRELCDYVRFSNELSQELGMGLPTDVDPDTQPELVARIQAIVGDMPIEPQELLSARHIEAADPPQHTRLRRITNRAFTPRRVQVLDGRIREVTAQCLSGIETAERFEIISQLAAPLPETIIGEILGMDPGDFHLTREFTERFTAAQYSANANSDEAIAEKLAVHRDFSKYFYPLITASRPSRTGVISVLTRSTHEDNLSLPETMMFLWLLMAAGNHTTRQLIGSMVVALFENPDQLALLEDRSELVPNVIEETLRYYPPVRFAMRQARLTTSLAGVEIPAGAKVLGIWASANRDPEVFPDPDRFDITRDASRHITFGHGIHFCLGAHLARLEGQAALEGLLPHLRRFQLDLPLQFIPQWMQQGFESVQLVAA